MMSVILQARINLIKPDPSTSKPNNKCQLTQPNLNEGVQLKMNVNLI